MTTTGSEPGADLALARKILGESDGSHAATACIIVYEKRHGHVALTDPKATDWIMETLSQLGTLGTPGSLTQGMLLLVRGFVEQMCVMERAVSEAITELNYTKSILASPVGPWGFRPR